MNESTPSNQEEIAEVSSRARLSLSKPLDGFLHQSLTDDEELLRRGRLQIRFGILGGVMAIAYSAFFFFLGHYWGGAIVAVSGISLIHVPWVIRRTGNVNICSHIYGAVLVLAFSGLCAVGGGLQGPANAWLAAVPLCALLLMNLRIALTWSAICFATIVAFAALDMQGIGFPMTYDVVAESAIAAASNVGLIIFLTFLGLLYEQTRIEAFTQNRETNARLALANQDLTDLNRQKNEFLNIAAHDLKNPLSIICGYADLLRELESPTLKQIRDQASEILRSGNHMLDIIRNILDVRSIEDGRKRLARKRLSIQDIIQNLQTDYSHAADQKNINLIYTVSTHPPEAWADPGATYQVLDNLFSNAIKYTPRDGTVTIGISQADKFLAVRVTDTGPGLSPEDQSKLWGKFVRLTPRPTGGESSNGLGLWIVRRLAEEMGGTAFCISKTGRGSTFGIQLPLWINQEEIKADYGLDFPEGAEGAMDFDRLVADITAQAESKNRKTETEDLREENSSADIALPS